jgi:hypothetical protein
MDEARDNSLELTDSPWFWVCVFSAMALAGTIAIAPKYEARQRQIELRFEARQRSQEFSDRLDAADGDSARVRSEMSSEHDEEPYDDSRELVVRLTPILLLLSAVFLASLGRVCWLHSVSERAPLWDARRAVLLLLAVAYCGATCLLIWFAYSGGSTAEESGLSPYKAWVLGRGMKSLLLFLISSILIALAASQLWKRKSTTV